MLWLHVGLRHHLSKTRRRQRHPTPVLLPGKSHGRRSLVGCSPWGHWESGTTEWLHFDFSLSCIGAGNGSPLQCSCLENPRDGGAWWAAVYGVAQSRTQLKWLSSSSSSSLRLGTVPLTFRRTLWVVFWITLDTLRTVESASQTLISSHILEDVNRQGEKSSQITHISISNAEKPWVKKSA